MACAMVAAVNAERHVRDLSEVSTVFAAAAVAVEVELVDSGRLAPLTEDTPTAARSAYWLAVRDATFVRISDLGAVPFPPRGVRRGRAAL